MDSPIRSIRKPSQQRSRVQSTESFSEPYRDPALPIMASEYAKLWDSYEQGPVRLASHVCMDVLKGLQRFTTNPTEHHRQQVIHASPCVTYLCLRHERRELLRQRLLHHVYMRLHKCRTCGFDPNKWIQFMDLLTPQVFYSLWSQDACFDLLTGDFWPIDEASNLHDCYHLIDSQTPMDVHDYRMNLKDYQGCLGGLHQDRIDRHAYIKQHRTEAREFLEMFPQVGDSMNDAHPDFVPENEEDEYYLPAPHPKPVELRAICDKIQVAKRDHAAITTKYKDVLEYRGAGSSELPSHKITLKADAKFTKKQRNYPMDKKEKDFYWDQCQSLQSKGVTEWVKDIPADLPFTVDNLPHMKAVIKKDGSWRAIIPAIELNTNTVKDLPNLPNINTILANIGPFRCCSVLDLHSGFFQIPLHPASQHLTMFRTPFGLMYYKVMAMGLIN